MTGNYEPFDYFSKKNALHFHEKLIRATETHLKFWKALAKRDRSISELQKLSSEATQAEEMVTEQYYTPSEGNSSNKKISELYGDFLKYIARDQKKSEEILLK